MGSHRFVLPLLLAVQVCALPGIFKAVEKDSVEDLEAHLKADPTQLNAIGPDGQTPLMNAVLTGKVNAVKFLLSKGADTTIGEKDGYTPMHGVSGELPLQGARCAADARRRARRRGSKAGLRSPRYSSPTGSTRSMCTRTATRR